MVPSQRLEAIARTAWHQAADRVERIPNGIPVQRFAAPPLNDAISGLDRREGELLIGTVAGLRAVKNLPRLVRAFAAMRDKRARLVIVGEGPEKPRILEEAHWLGVADRLHLPGFLAEPSRYIGLLDIFALSSDSEQFPISLVEAMAAGVPVVSTGVGDIPSMIADANRPLIVGADDEPAFTAALDSLAERPDLRQAIGTANARKAAAEYDEGKMIERYARLYGEAIGAPRAFLSALA